MPASSYDGVSCRRVLRRYPRYIDLRSPMSTDSNWNALVDGALQHSLAVLLEKGQRRVRGRLARLSLLASNISGPFFSLQATTTNCVDGPLPIHRALTAFPPSAATLETSPTTKAR